MCQITRRSTDPLVRRQSTTGKTINELNKKELLALLNPASSSNNNEQGDDNTQSWAQCMLSSSLSIPFGVITLVITTVLAFSIGCVARVYILSSQQSNYGTSIEGGVDEEVHQLPAPTIIPGKEVPYTTYTSKHFQMPGSATSNTLHIDRSSAIQKEGGSYNPSLEEDTSALAEPEEESTMNEHSHNTDESGEHLPAGQHLLRKFYYCRYIRNLTFANHLTTHLSLNLCS